jgi:hypothetical protein
LGGVTLGSGLGGKLRSIAPGATVEGTVAARHVAGASAAKITIWKKRMVATEGHSRNGKAVIATTSDEESGIAP